MSFSNYLPGIILIIAALACTTARSHTVHGGQQPLHSSPPKCPPPSQYPDFFSDPDSCDGYWMCTNGYPVYMKCAPSLWWSQELTTCVPAGTTPCAFLTTTTTSTTTTSTTTTTPAPEPPTTTDPPRPTTTEPEPEPPTTQAPPETTTAAPEPEPPTTPEAPQPPTTTQAPYTTETTEVTFTEQTSTTHVEEPHPPTTEKPEDPEPSSTAAATTTTTAPPPVPTTERERFPCPSDPFIYLPHDESCHLFYLCTNGEFRGIFNCGSQHWFDSASQGCRRPEESDCTLQPRP